MEKRMSSLTPDQHELVELCRRRAAALRELINLITRLTGIDLTTGEYAIADQPAYRNEATPPDDGACEPPTPYTARSIRRDITACLAEVTWLSAQINQLEDEIGPPDAA
jgi:hypothetical protein